MSSTLPVVEPQVGMRVVVKLIIRPSEPLDCPLTETGKASGQIETFAGSLVSFKVRQENGTGRLKVSSKS